MNPLSIQEEPPVSLFSEEELLQIDPNRVPYHVAIIMDGNRRWAREKGMPAILGHWKGAEALTRTVQAAADLGIRVLTVYAFSTENWGRSSKEVDSLMELFNHYLIHEKSLMINEGVKLESIGDISRLPPFVRQTLIETKEATSQGSRIELVLALNYGGRDDIRRALIAIAEDYKNSGLTAEEISEERISGYLDTARWPDPDILIRTSGEKRQSNFLLWQLCYSEFYHPDVLWPNFGAYDLLLAVKEYQKRKRRLGKA